MTFFRLGHYSYKTGLEPGLGWKKPWPYTGFVAKFHCPSTICFYLIEIAFLSWFWALKCMEFTQIFHCVFRGNNQSNSFRALVVLVRALGRTRVSFQMPEWVGDGLARLKSFRLSCCSYWINKDEWHIKQKAFNPHKISLRGRGSTGVSSLFIIHI